MEGAGAGSSRSSRHGRSSRKVSGLLPAALASMNVAPENDDHVGSSGGGGTDSSGGVGGGDVSSGNGGGNRGAEDPTTTTTAKKAKRPSRVAGTKPALQVDVGGLRTGQRRSGTGQQEGGEQRAVGTVAGPRVPVEQWTTFNVSSWLQRSNLSDAIDPFGTHRIDGVGLRELRILLVGPVTPPPTPQQHGEGGTFASGGGGVSTGTETPSSLAATESQTRRANPECFYQLLTATGVDSIGLQLRFVVCVRMSLHVLCVLCVHLGVLWWSSNLPVNLPAALTGVMVWSVSRVRRCGGAIVLLSSSPSHVTDVRTGSPQS